MGINLFSGGSNVEENEKELPHVVITEELVKIFRGKVDNFMIAASQGVVLVKVLGRMSMKERHRQEVLARLESLQSEITSIYQEPLDAAIRCVQESQAGELTVQNCRPSGVIASAIGNRFPGSGFKSSEAEDVVAGVLLTIRNKGGDSWETEFSMDDLLTEMRNSIGMRFFAEGFEILRKEGFLRERFDEEKKELFFAVTDNFVQALAKFMPGLADK